MELKYFSVKEVQKHKVSIEHISTKLMNAYSLTKGLAPKTFIEQVERMGFIDTTTQCIYSYEFENCSYYLEIAPRNRIS